MIDVGREEAGRTTSSHFPPRVVGAACAAEAALSSGHHPNAPFAVAPAVEGDFAPIRRPCELFGRGIVKDSLHRSGLEIEEPRAVTHDLEDDEAAVGRHRWRTNKSSRLRRSID